MPNATTPGGFTDASTAYANAHNLWITFMGVGTGRAVRFKAAITSYSDKFSSKWNEEEVYGRMDPIVTFQSTARTLSLEFDVASSDQSEALDNFGKLSLLIGLLYPGYSGGSANSMSTAPLFKVTFANWINGGSGGSVKESGLVGAIKGFDFSPDLENQGVYDDPGFLTPQGFKIAMEMTVLHTHHLGWSGSNWRGNTAFPWGAGMSKQPKGLELPDKTVTETDDDGASGTDEMVAAAESDILEPAGMTGVTEEGVGFTEDVTEFQTTA